MARDMAWHLEKMRMTLGMGIGKGMWIGYFKWNGTRGEGWD
jgi:hypothetical protein